MAVIDKFKMLSHKLQNKYTGPKFSQNSFVLILIVLAVMLRVLPHPANFAPVGAIALFGGVYLGRRQALWLPLVIMIVSDVIIGLHSTILFTWGSFLLIAAIGMAISKRRNVPRVMAASLTGSLIFFFVTNFGVWAVTPLYAKNWSGLVACFVAAIPFFRNTMVSDILFVGVLFGAYEAIRRLANASRTLTVNT